LTLYIPTHRLVKGSAARK